MNTKISPYLREEPISVTMSGMNDLHGRIVDQQGMSVLAVPFALSVIFLIGAIAFGAWAFMQMQDYKNNVAAKVRGRKPGEATRRPGTAGNLLTEREVALSDI